MLQHIVFDLGVGCPILKFGHIHIFQRELNPNLFSSRPRPWKARQPSQRVVVTPLSRGIRNGGLDVTQNRRSTRKIHYGRTKLPALQRFFFFPRLAGQDRLVYSVLVLLLFDCLFQPVKTLITDDVFNTAGIGLRSFGVNACGDKLLGKEAVTLVDFFRLPRGPHRSDGESDLRPS